MSQHQIQIPARIEEFFRQSFRKSRLGRRRLLALTYEFDPAAFERAFASLLRWPILIDVVAGQSFRGSIAGVRGWRARWPGTFHPKLICLLANDTVCVGLGSANLTSGGLGENLETWSFFEGDENQSVLAGVRDFLVRLEDRHVLPDAVRCGEIIDALPIAAGQSAILSTLHGNLVDQVSSNVRMPVRRVDIISPINCDPAPVLRRLRKTIKGSAEYHLFASERPVPEIEGITTYHRLKRPERNDEGERLRTVSIAHAKIYGFEIRNQVELFWGSANLSYSAWLAKGNNANIDLLVHSRVRLKDWRRFRDRGLPSGHRWILATPRGKPPLDDPERADGGWQVLHALLERGEVTLEATEPKRCWLWLRTAGRPAVKCNLRFAKRSASLPESVARKLGFTVDDFPRSLEWRPYSGGEWELISVNALDEIRGSGRSGELVEQLLWEFAGRMLPKHLTRAVGISGRTRRGGKKQIRSKTQSLGEETPGSPKDTIVKSAPNDVATKNGQQTSPEEDELTRSEHQGELDRFVLEWRLAARRVALAAGANPSLRRNHIDSILRRVDADALKSPLIWPSFKLEFVRELLERPWRG